MRARHGWIATGEICFGYSSTVAEPRAKRCIPDSAMGQFGWVQILVIAAIAFPAAALAAVTPSGDIIDCYPHPASAPYSSAAHPPVLSEAVSRPPGGAALPSASSRPTPHPYSAHLRRTAGRHHKPHLHRISHPRPHGGPMPVHKRRVAAAAPHPAPTTVAAAPGGGVATPFAGLTHARVPRACAPAPTPVTAGPTIAALAPLPGFPGVTPPSLPSEIGPGTPGTETATPTGPGTDTETTTDTVTIFPPLGPWPPDVITMPDFPPPVTPPGPPPGGVPEPTTWMLLIVGLLGTGLALRQRRRGPI